MKKFLLVFLVMLTFLLVSCTYDYSPFGAFFGGYTTTVKRAMITLDFSNINDSQAYVDDADFFILELNGPQSLKETIYKSSLPENLKKTFQVKPGEYTITIKAYKADGTNIGEYTSTTTLKNKQEDFETVVFNEVITFNLIFDLPDSEENLISSRALTTDSNLITLIVKKGKTTDENDPEIYKTPAGGTEIYTTNQFVNDTENGYGNCAEITVSLSSGHNYAFEAYVQNNAYQPSPAATPITITYAYGSTFVPLVAGFSDDILIETAEITTESTPSDVNNPISHASLVNPEVTITFPATYTDNLFNSPNYFVNSNEVHFRCTYDGTATTALEGATSTAYKNETAEVETPNNAENQMYIKYKTNQAESIDFAEDATGLYYFWFTATDTNQMPFVFPLKISGFTIEGKEDHGVTVF